MTLANKKSLFSIPKDVTYLNCANMSPLLKSANQAGIEAINMRNNPWKTKTEDWFNSVEELRTLFSKIINADTENIALVPSVSYGIAIAANNILLKADQKIIILDQQFPSNVYAWRELSKNSGAEIVTIKRKSNKTWTEAVLDKIDKRTGLVAIPNCHWTDGSLIDLKQISKEIKRVDAKLVIDASQSLGAYPLDVNEIKPDFLIAVGYKWLLGSYGLGYFYADQKYCETGKPIEYSWLNKTGSEDFTNLTDYKDEYRTGARRFDFGEFPGFINIPIAISALTQILEWGVENIQDTLSELTGEIEKKAKESGYKTVEKKNRVGHMIGVQFSDKQVSLLSKKLIDNKIYVSFRGTNIRIAPHLYNNLDDVNRLFNYL